MVRPKAGSSSSKKPKPKQKQKQKQRGGVDFKKYKYKVGRKLPPPKNATNTEIKSKAIVLPEQSMASERAGMAVNKRGLTLRELLQQTAHYNANVRRAALHGIKDIIIKHPSELNLHKVAIIEKLQERICDADKVVRETLYNILQSLIFPSLKEDNEISTRSTLFLLMANVLNGMTHLSIDVQLMAFRFLELVVLNFPSSFPRYAEQAFNNFVAVLNNNKIYLQDRDKLNSVLSGLGHCLSLVSSMRENDDSSTQQGRPFFSCCSQVYDFFMEELLKSTADEGAFVIFSNTLIKLQSLVQILINSIEVSASELCAKSVIDTQSNEALLLALHCLNMICRIFIHEMKKPQMKFGMSKPKFGPDWLQSSILVHLKKLWGVKRLFHEKEDDRFFIFNVKIAEIFLCLSAWMDDTAFPSEDFCQFVASLLAKAKILRSKDLMEKHLGPLITSVPDLVSNATGCLKRYLLEAFTDAFRDCKVDCKLILVYLAAVEEMLLPEKSGICLAKNDSELLEYHSSWIDELSGILLRSVDKDPSVTKVVLELLLRIGQHCPAMVDGNLLPLIKLFGLKSSSGTIEFGPFINLPRDCQELAISCLYYFSSLLPDVLEALTSCCLSDELEPFILLSIVEVLQSAYRSGHLQISEQLSFLLLLMARFKVYPGIFWSGESVGKVSNWNTFKSLNHLILTSLSQMGDGSLVLELMWNSLYNEMARKPSLHNMNGLFRIIVALDAQTPKLADEDVVKLIAGYLVDTALDLSKTIELGFQPDKTRLFQYFIKPCIVMFDRNDKKLHRNLSLSKSAIKGILHYVRHLLDSTAPGEQKQKLHFAFEQLKTKALQLNCWDRSELEEISSAEFNTICDAI